MKRALNAPVTVILAAAGILTALVGAVFYVIRQMSRLPDNVPARFVIGGKPRDKRLAVILGASMVHGRVGANFVDLLAQRFSGAGLVFANAGINGDTSYHISKRLDPVIACDPDYVVILAGTNDAICTLNDSSWRSYRSYKALPERPTLEWYRANLRDIVGRLKSKTRAKIILCSLPVLGEDLASLANERIREFNAVIKEIASEEGVAYAPVFESEEAYLTEQGHTNGRIYTGDAIESLRLGFLGNLQHYLFGRSYDSMSRTNGMLLKTDLVHGNDREAQIIAEQIGALLEERQASPALVAGGVIQSA